MLTPQELRIGNYITAYGNKLCKIAEIHFKGGLEVENCNSSNPYIQKANIEDVSGIPLTEELLLRCEFGIRDTSVSKEFHFGINPVTHDWLISLIWLKNITDLSLEGFPFYKNGFHEIKYLHTLQNLTNALTGQELTIKEANPSKV